MKKLFLVVAMVLAAMPALAVTLDEARSKNWVAEQPDGFVKVLSASPEVSALAKDVNTRRAAEYARISKENGQPIDVVGKLAAAQIAQKLGK